MKNKKEISLLLTACVCIVFGAGLLINPTNIYIITGMLISGIIFTVQLRQKE